MRIKRVQIENFRAIAHFDEEIGPYTAFIGYNGGGKSSILHALRWFFEDFPLEKTDVFSENPPVIVPEKLPDVKVSVTFDCLSDLDRTNFGPYATGETMVLTRKGGVEHSSKLFGDRMVCKEFSTIRNASKVAEKRQAAIDLMGKNPIFKDLGIDKKTGKNEIDCLLEQWETDPTNSEHLSPINDEVASHFFGAVGTDKLKIDSGFVFIPAAPNLTGEFDSTGKGSALQLLLGDILKGVVGKSVETWSVKNRVILDELESTVRESAARQLELRAQQVNHHLRDYLPGVEIEFNVGLQDWAPKANPVAQSLMRRGDREIFIESEGHGVQRATLLALLQATAEARVTPPLSTGADSETEDLNTSTPENSLIVFVEEPEVYQHPVQARMMARSFVRAAEKGNVQFILATHSPYFLAPEHLNNTFRVSHKPTGSIAHRPKPNENLQKKFLTGESDKFFLESIVETLFSRAALVVEGDTDRAILDAISSDEGTLRDAGVSVAVAEGAKSLITIASLIRSFGVPTYILRDGDSDVEVARQRAEVNFSQQAKKQSNGELDDKNSDYSEEISKKMQQTLNSWKESVEDFVKAARANEFGEGLEEYSWQGGLRGRNERCNLGTRP